MATRHSLAPSISPPAEFTKPVTGHSPPVNEYAHSWVWHFEAGLGHQTHGTGLARKEGSICDHKSVRLWTFPVHPVLEVKKENSEMEYKRFYNIDGVNRR